jgi:protein TonB
VIASDGAMNNVHVLSSPSPDLSQAAVDAVEQWEFDPALLDGVPVETLIQVTVEFQIGQ